MILPAGCYRLLQGEAMPRVGDVPVCLVQVIPSVWQKLPKEPLAAEVSTNLRFLEDVYGKLQPQASELGLRRLDLWLVSNQAAQRTSLLKLYNAVKNLIPESRFMENGVLHRRWGRVDLQQALRIPGALAFNIPLSVDDAPDDETATEIFPYFESSSQPDILPGAVWNLDTGGILVQGKSGRVTILPAEVPPDEQFTVFPARHLEFHWRIKNVSLRKRFCTFELFS